ncbi:PREDICTED: photosystem II reaction center W protein, chloroplastic-like [Camelina sativa]|uniref:PSII 6.1 kDa protein n=1 Tax=Camelina sativa TaxID=90675 RepID=A0ABM0Z4K1_CAMSA|nr:PREDICTED: photosystem II reaction center W protein, chloroplastic-like [Camelina sativa]
MASFTASASTVSAARPALLLKPTVAVSAPVLGLPPMGKKKGGVRCSMETKQEGNVTAMGAGVSAAATAALTAVMSNPAIALVDERMSTEGTGLPFGLSNNLLGWILFGVFGLIWTFYFVYTSSLEEDEESGLSL